MFIMSPTLLRELVELRHYFTIFQPSLYAPSKNTTKLVQAEEAEVLGMFRAQRTEKHI